MREMLIGLLLGLVIGLAFRWRISARANSYAATGPRTFEVSSYSMGETLRRAAAKKGGA